ncbi:MerR family DNA-binding protein [Abyssibacter profundi]|uniref:Heavy metal-responsive transcriptional regulator n=1 Tax=Abyssibacter profundi TaxID=2182787 RepID=A0A363UQC3_9GAMM|nr:MerR family DNA-binding protein [Abyssibacter profundi]PWN57699.1 heavy metal-responsive transcriptional regulator [Abyssibacter profundi]
MNTSKPLTIGRLARATGLSVETIRYYEREGILPEPQRTAANYRLYPTDSIERLRFVLRAKTLGFSLAEIRTLLGLQGGGDRAAVRALAQAHLEDIERRIRDLNAMRRVLRQAVADCDGQGSTVGCPIIQAIEADAASSQEGIT